MACSGKTDETAPTATRRQRPGAVCEECRRRKLQCDRSQPQCGVCRDAGVACEVTKRGPRGPKRGHLTALKTRVKQLEAMLSHHVPAQDDQQQYQQVPSPNDEEQTSATSLTETTEPTTTELCPTKSVVPPATSGFPNDLAFLPHEWVFPSTVPAFNNPIPPTDALQEELDQLYFDRVHQSMPILHRRRYLSWSKSSTKTAPKRCLQYSMWTLASLLSIQFRDMIDPLYQETKQMLETLCGDGDNDPNNGKELAQAWVFLVIFESMRANHQKAWMSAGRTFRLVQALRYHEIDSPVNDQGSSPPHCGDFIDVEEKRRVFWIAYFFDHVISMRDDFPITLNEHVICTRLPIPDDAFQAGQNETGPFLSEAISNPTVRLRSSFTECLILVTICGRSLLQSQQYHISKAYGDMSLDWAEQRRWLDNLLNTRLEILSNFYPPPADAFDPLLLFANLLGQAVIIYIYKFMRQSAASPDSNQQSSYENRALYASQTINSLASILCDLPFSKVHPLTPVPLFLCAEFLYNNIHSDVSFQLALHELLGILRTLKNVDNHEQSYLDLLPKSCLAKTNELLNHSFAGRISN